MTRLELRFSDEGICHCAVTWYYLGKIQLGTANEMILKTFWAVLVVVNWLACTELNPRQWDQIRNKKKPNFSSKVAQKLAIKA